MLVGTLVKFNFLTHSGNQYQSWKKKKEVYHIYSCFSFLPTFLEFVQWHCLLGLL